MIICILRKTNYLHLELQNSVIKGLFTLWFSCWILCRSLTMQMLRFFNLISHKRISQGFLNSWQAIKNKMAMDFFSLLWFSHFPFMSLSPCHFLYFLLLSTPPQSPSPQLAHCFIKSTLMLSGVLCVYWVSYDSPQHAAGSQSRSLCVSGVSGLSHYTLSLYWLSSQSPQVQVLSAGQALDKATEVHFISAV